MNLDTFFSMCEDFPDRLIVSYDGDDYEYNDVCEGLEEWGKKQVRSFSVYIVEPYVDYSIPQPPKREPYSVLSVCVE